MHWYRRLCRLSTAVGLLLILAALCSRPGFAGEVLLEFLPAQGPGGAVGHHVTPDGVVDSNALSVAGMDYIDPTSGALVAALFGAQTADAPYFHDVVTCQRVQNFELQAVSPIRYREMWLWALRLAHPKAGYNELVIPLAIRLQGSRAAVDSRYLVEYYPANLPGIFLNYQVAARDLPDALFLVDAILSAVRQKYTLTYANRAEPPLPTVFARKATYQYPNIKLVVQNEGKPRMVSLFGPTWAEPRHGVEKFVRFTRALPEGQSEVTLPVGRIHDAILYLEADGFLDKCYLASGYWFSWTDAAGGGTSQVSLRTSELQHPSIQGAVDWFTSPPLAEMTGRVGSFPSWAHVGMGYTFAQGRDPIDVSGASTVAFWAKGDGRQYRVTLQSAAVADNDHHGAVFVAPPEWTLVAIPFTALKQEGWGKKVVWTGKEIHTIAFTTQGHPLDSVRLMVDRISLIK